MEDCESCTCSRDAEGAYWAASFSDIPACVLSNSTPIVAKCCCKDSETESCQGSPFGMTLEHSMAGHGKASRILSARGSRVRDFQQSEMCMVADISMAGRTPPESLSKSSPHMPGLKTSNQSSNATCRKLFETLTPWGMMRDGVVFPVRTPAQPLRKKASGSFCWRRPAASDWKRRNLDWPSVRKPGNPLCLPQQLAQLGHHGYLNPQFPTWLMGWPDTWAKLAPLEMVRFQAWLDSHGKP